MKKIRRAYFLARRGEMVKQKKTNQAIKLTDKMAKDHKRYLKEINKRIFSGQIYTSQNGIFSAGILKVPKSHLAGLNDLEIFFVGQSAKGRKIIPFSFQLTFLELRILKRLCSKAIRNYKRYSKNKIKKKNKIQEGVIFGFPFWENEKNNTI